MTEKELEIIRQMELEASHYEFDMDPPQILRKEVITRACEVAQSYSGEFTGPNPMMIASNLLADMITYCELNDLDPDRVWGQAWEIHEREHYNSNWR